jgi:hypothetical protein
MKLAPNFIRSLFARSESSPPTASGDDVVPADSSTDDGDALFSPGTYHDARTGLTPSSLSGEETASPDPDHEDLGSAPPSDVDSPVEAASDSSSPPGARVLFQGLQGLDEDQEPAEADKVSLEGGEEEEALNKTFSDDSEEDPKAKSNDAADGDDEAVEPETKTSDDDEVEPELSASDDDAAELEPAAAVEACHVPSRSNDSVEIQEVDRPQLAPRTSSRLAAARARQMAAAAAAERNRPFLQGAPIPDNGPRPEPDFEIGDWLYAEWPTNHVRLLSMRSIVFF